MNYIVALNGKKFEVEVNETEAVLLGVSESAPSVSIASESVTHTQTITKNEEESVKAKTKAASADGLTIKAPMPGTILAVNLIEGAQIKKGDVMFVLEAMKMENDIVAPEDGVVKQVSVSKGEMVNTDDILGVI